MSSCRLVVSLFSLLLVTVPGLLALCVCAGQWGGARSLVCMRWCVCAGVYALVCMRWRRYETSLDGIFGKLLQLSTPSHLLYTADVDAYGKVRIKFADGKLSKGRIIY